MIRVTVRTRPTRRLVFDLESRPSAFWFGDKTTAEITAIGWKWEHEPGVHTLMLRQDGRFLHDDRKRPVSAHHAYSLFRGELAAADLVYGHNVSRFDLPLFQAGLHRLQLPMLPELRVTDTLTDYPKAKDMSRSLENLSEMHGVDEQGKKHMSVRQWEQANKLTPAGIREARERVTTDVLLQERLRLQLVEEGRLSEPRRWRPGRR